MDTLAAFMMSQFHRDEELMVFDWCKAAELIKEHNPKVVFAGLRSDWEYTGGPIFSDGKIDKDSYTYLASTWAVPEIEMDGEVMECYVMQSERPDWDSDTKWPEEAIEILNDTAEEGNL